MEIASKGQLRLAFLRWAVVTAMTTSWLAGASQAFGALTGCWGAVATTRLMGALASMSWRADSETTCTG